MSDDPILNCVLEVCCAAGSASQRGAMADLIVRDCTCDPVVAKRVGDYLLSKFDLAEKGTLQAFKASIVRVSRAPSA